METNPGTPKRILIEVTQGGERKADVRIPYALFKLGMNIARTAASPQGVHEGVNPADYLRDVDLQAVQDALNAGELTLPCRLVDVDEPEKATHVTITLE